MRSWRDKPFGRPPGDVIGTPHEAKAPSAPAHPARVRRVVLFAAVAIAVVGGATAVFILTSLKSRGGAALSPMGQNSRGSSSVPPAEASQVKATLLEMGALCTPTADGPAQRRLGQDVDLLVQFAGRYPAARLTIDDETATPTDILLVARHDLSGCAPAASARANQALPSALRAGLPTASRPGS
jgi:hypothetical protein